MASSTAGSSNSSHELLTFTCFAMARESLGTACSRGAAAVIGAWWRRMSGGGEVSCDQWETPCFTCEREERIGRASECPEIKNQGGGFTHRRRRGKRGGGPVGEGNGGVSGLGRCGTSRRSSGWA
uniref:Uncharacterized protein n=1 Tax=Arundo donax TaxID=35708 RepID=A0A0A9DQU0_ARUDO